MNEPIETTIDPAGVYTEEYVIQKRKLNHREIFNIVVDKVIAYGPYRFITPELIMIKTRQREIAATRQIVMYFYKTMTNESLKSVGLMFITSDRPLGFDHSTIIHAVQKVKDLCEFDKIYRHRIELVKIQLEMVLGSETISI